MLEQLCTEIREINHRRYAVLVVVSWMVVLVAWAFSSLPGSYPDEPFHMANAYCAGEHPADQCDVVDAIGYVRGPAAILDSKHWWWDNPLIIRMGDYRADNYSPTYYRVTSWLMSDDIRSSIARIRIFNLLLTVSVLVVAYRLSHRSVRNAFVFTVLLMSVTYGHYFMASNHPLSWAYAGVVSFGVCTSSILRHERLVKKISTVCFGMFSAMFALSARRESFVAILFIILVTMLIERHRLRRMAIDLGLFKLALGGLVLVLTFVAGIWTGVIRLIYPLNRQGWDLLISSFDIDRFIWNLWASPVIVIRLLAGTRDDNSVASDPLGYWVVSMVIVFWATTYWFANYSREKPLNRVDHVLVSGICSVVLISPVVYILPRPFDLLGPNLFPTRYLLLVFSSALYLVYLILDPDGRIVLSSRRYAFLVALIGISHAMSHYFNFIPKGSQDIPVLNIAKPHADFEGWWFQSFSPMSLWLIGVAGTVGLFVGIRRAGLIRVYD